ncbi:hypothetical protein MKW98_006046, partial [Papaver atlanticum]
YEQVRLWVLRHSDENTEWEAKYDTYVSNFNRTRAGRMNPLDYVPWLQDQLEELEGTTMTDFLIRQHWNLVLESPIRSDPNKNAFEDPFVFTGAASEAMSILATFGDDEYWNEDAPLNDEYLDEDFQGTT